MNYKQQLIDNINNLGALKGIDLPIYEIQIYAPQHLIDTATSMIMQNYQWYLNNLTTPTKYFRLVEWSMLTEQTILVLGEHQSHLLFPCEIEERFPYGKDQIGYPKLFSKYGEYIDISVVYYPSDEDWEQLYLANREYLIRQYLYYEQEQEENRIKLEKRNNVINKYGIV